MPRFPVTLVLCLTLALPASAQQRAWVQIEAQPSQRQADARAAILARRFDDLAGFTLAGGWHALALGPYTPEAARDRRRTLRRAGRIPRDSFVADGTRYRGRFWPDAARQQRSASIGSDAPLAAPAETGVRASDPAAPQPETRADSRRSERRMTRKERRELQKALHFEGVYEGAIDADFGPGTRRAMRAWQRDAGVAPTGILTSRQRARIVKTYRQAFAELGLETVRDEDAGIAVTLPTKLVEFDRYAPPFAHYDAADGSGVRVLLISQNGDHDTLTGLFQVMQTLEIVPTSGKRSKRGTSFFIEGRNARLQSYTFAALRGGRIKGFTLAWPPDRAKIMSEAVGIMRESFQRIGDTTLDDSRAPPAPQRDLDTISGLAVRRPEISRTGFYVDAAGTVVTTSEVLSRCARLTVGAGHEARIAARDPALGLAVLRPRQTLAPIGYARFAEGAPRLRTEVAVAGFSYGAVLDLPTLTFGQLAALRGLDGDEVLQRLDLAALPGDRGGPVFDSSGAVLGALVAPVGENRQLPRNVSFAARAAEIAKLLEGSGTSVARADGGEKLAPRELTARAADMTVPVSCWN